jgi:hypothetical protein
MLVVCKGWASIVFGETSLLGAGMRILKREKKERAVEP